MDPDPDPVSESGSNPDPDPQPCRKVLRLKNVMLQERAVGHPYIKKLASNAVSEKKVRTNLLSIKNKDTCMIEFCLYLAFADLRCIGTIVFCKPKKLIFT
jgi:hypothetical protein